jgi:hypothetical protein
MYTSIREIEAANERAGQHWFSANTTGFFKSRIGATIYGGRYFTSSEQMGSFPRRYSVRRANDDGTIETMGNFDGFATRGQAVTFAKKLAKLPDGPHTHEVTERQRDGYRGRVCGDLTEGEAALITLHLNDKTNVYGIPEGGMIYAMAPDRYGGR